MQDRSIAVLPFQNLSSEKESEFFSDGMTEEIINALSRVEGLKVIARTSSFAFKDSKLQIKEIGKQLGVGLILEGSVRKAGQRVRISVKLVAVSDEFTMWSEKYDREMGDIFEVQDDIADQILSELRLQLEKNLTSSNFTRNTAAYEMLLKGNYFFKRDYEGTVKALDYFREAVRLDPEYAEAHALVAETLIHHSAFGLISTIDAHEQARSSAYTALSLNQYEPIAHKVLAYIHLFYDWNWEAARSSYLKALRFGLSEQNEFITYYHIFLNGDAPEAIRIAKKILETDPLHAESHWQLGICYYFAQRFKDALKAFNNALDLDSQYSEAHRWKATVLGYLGRCGEAKESMATALKITAEDPFLQFNSLILKVQCEEKDDVYHALQKNEYIDPMDPAQVYAVMGAREEAFTCLEAGIKARSVMTVTLKYYWIWDNLREDERFVEICEQLNFPDSAWEEVQNKAEDKAELDEESIAILEKLKLLMEEDMIYLDPTLNLRSLADELAVHPNKMSWLINENLGKNFNEYVNGMRLERFKEMAMDPANKKITLLGLAYESGFNSKSVFNDFFKKSTGITPRAWVKSRTLEDN